MSAESLRLFKEKLEEGFTVTLSVYEDQHGVWAKDVEYVDRVRVKFSDAETLFLTMDEVQGLTRSQRDAIDHAPSSDPVSA